MARRPNTFELDSFHIALARRLEFRWGGEEYDGAPEVDPKRPYGNSDVLGDLKEIYAQDRGYDLYEVDGPNGYEVLYRLPGGELLLPDSQNETLWAHHGEMPFVLEILRSTIGETLEPGTYELKEPYSSNWVRVVE